MTPTIIVDPNLITRWKELEQDKIFCLSYTEFLKKLNPIKLHSKEINESFIIDTLEFVKIRTQFQSDKSGTYAYVVGIEG